MSRYIIESSYPELRDVIAGLDDTEIVDEYDPMERLNAKVEKIGAALREFKEGNTWRLFLTYMRGKGISNQDVEKVVDGIDSFLKDAGVSK